jgi:hypothetical protein
MPICPVGVSSDAACLAVIIPPPHPTLSAPRGGEGMSADKLPLRPFRGGEGWGEVGFDDYHSHLTKRCLNGRKGGFGLVGFWAAGLSHVGTTAAALAAQSLGADANQIDRRNLGG